MAQAITGSRRRRRKKEEACPLLTALIGLEVLAGGAGQAKDRRIGVDLLLVVSLVGVQY